MIYYKVLEEDGAARMGTGKWPLPSGEGPGEWISVEGELVPCENGLHLCRSKDLVNWLGPAIFEAEADESEMVVERDKVVVRRARLLRRLHTWNEKTARLFAADCAERVLPIFERSFPDDDSPRKAIEAARAYARGEIDDTARDAARDAASAAARDAAWTAARTAASAAAGTAARTAAWDAGSAAAGTAARTAAWDAGSAAGSAAAWTAARDAARTAARGAARDAAWTAASAAARKWQAERLFFYLNGEADV